MNGYTHMTTGELKEQLQEKYRLYEAALEAGSNPLALKEMYKEIRELHFELANLWLREPAQA